MRERFLPWAFSLSAGVSDGVVAASSLVKKVPLPIAMLISVAVGAAKATSAFLFQGKAMREALQQDKLDEEEGLLNVVSIVSGESLQVGPGDEKNIEPLKDTGSTYGLICGAIRSSINSPIAKQTLYFSAALTSVIMKRIFTFRQIFSALELNPTIPGMAAVVAVDVAFGLGFRLTNEDYESMQGLGNGKTCYDPLMKHLAKIACLVRYVGVAEHVFIEELASPLVLLKKTTDELEDSTARTLTIAAASVTLAMLTPLLIVITNYFEGNHTSRNLGISNTQSAKSENSKSWFSCLPEVMRKGILIMGPVHGLATGAETALAVDELDELMGIQSKWPAALMGVVTAIPTALGVHYSEVSEAREELEREIQEHLQETVSSEATLQH